jgi:hypothetical protein
VKPCTVGWSESEENNFHSAAVGGFYSTSGDKSIFMGRLVDKSTLIAYSMALIFSNHVSISTLLRRTFWTLVLSGEGLEMLQPRQSRILSLVVVSTKCSRASFVLQSMVSIHSMRYSSTRFPRTTPGHTEPKTMMKMPTKLSEIPKEIEYSGIIPGNAMLIQKSRSPQHNGGLFFHRYGKTLTVGIDSFNFVMRCAASIKLSYIRSCYFANVDWDGLRGCTLNII